MKYEFKAEVKQVLDIVVNSLYTDKEIFLRELVSNASDAMEKLRFLKLSGQEVFEPEADLKIEINADEAARTVSVEDFGIGMTEKDLVENLGTIAHSGSKAFLNALKESGGDLKQQLIGQFGVGFYSAFMVADKVEVETRPHTLEGEALKWTCDGSSEFTIEKCPRSARGTKITVFLKKDFEEFAKKFRVRQIAEKYSSFIEFPIFINGEKLESVRPVWLKGKSEVKPEEYEAFFKFLEHSSESPSDYLHFSADAPIALNCLLYVPAVNPERLGLGRAEHSVSLYCKKVLIDAHPKNLLPEWMRFAKGVIDSADIPLNISRESMQDSALIKKIGRIAVKRFIKHLDELSKKDAEKFAKILKDFGNFIKEGAAFDFEHKDDLVKLLRFESSAFKAGETVSLADYAARMKEGQKDKIFYATGPDRQTIEEGPLMEAFKRRGIEVLFLYDTIDAYVLSNVGTFDGKSFASVDSADIELPDAPAPAGESLPADALKDLCDWLKSLLAEAGVTEVSDGKRLVDGPAAVLNADHFDPTMRKLMRMMNPDAPSLPQKVKLEINPRAALIKNLSEMRLKDEALAKLVAHQMLDNAMLSAGLLENPRAMAGRINELLAKIKIG